ncbi:MAG TPA: hypothetical protein VFR97_14415 [Capillimicrobium sp.]|nr:hypothetical protein [Capillimicrobium sp.]
MAAATTPAGIGPVQLVAIGFGPDADFKGRVWAELERLEQAGTIRLLDLLFVARDGETGDLVALEHQGEDLGGIVGALLGFPFDGDGSAPSAPPPAEERAFGMTQEDALALAASMPPGYAVGLLLLEHVWARELKRAVRDAGGVPIGEGFLTVEAVAAVAAELAAMAAELDEIQAAGAGSRS